MNHEANCRWQMTTPEECVYRRTHHYCPHSWHACSCVKVPAADDHEPYGTCDWGGCDEEVVRWRYSDEIGTHLPVCSAHSLEAENARLREQADALADALDKALFFAGERTSKLAQTRLSTCDTVLRAYREAVRHESEDKE